MDYGTLAQLSNPGQAAPGDRWGRIRRFQNLNNINQQALQSAMPVAESNAQRALQANQEWQDAAPGRRDLTTLGNMNAAAGVKNFDRDQEAAKLGIDVKNAEQMAKLADVTSDIGTDADAYSKALDTNDERLKSEIINKNKGRRLRNGYVVGTDPNTDDQLFKVAAIARANPPATQGKIAQEQVKGVNRLSLENIKLLNDKEKILLRGKLAQELQGARLTAAAAKDKSKPLSISQAFAARLDAKYGGDSDAWLEAYRLIEDGSKLLDIDKQAMMMRMFPELAKDMVPAAPRDLPPGNTETKPAPKTNAPKNAVPVTDALSKLNAAKGTADEEKMVKFFVDVYGREQLPAWVKTK